MAVIDVALVVIMTVTAYVPGAGGINGGHLGAHCQAGQCRVLQVGDCACGPRYPFGTVFVVDGKEYVCHDRGGAVTNRNLDLVFDNKVSAFEWGRQRKRVLVITKDNYSKWKSEQERNEREFKRLK